MFGRTKIFSLVALSRTVSLLALITIATGVQAHAMTYFVAVDNGPTVTFGPYQGLPNPNQGRLTFLYAHTSEENPESNHFHGIGAYSYAGPLENPHVVPTNSNNRIPEGFSEEPPLRLFPGRATSALALLNPKQYGGFRFISKPYESEYSDLTIASIQSLSTFPADSPEGYLFHSSGGRWASPLSGAIIAVELVAISEGLHIADETGEEILHHVGDVHVLGEGNSFSFTPVFWTDGRTAAGTYSVTLRVDRCVRNSRAAAAVWYLQP
jgi:hypothetical protein